MCAACKGQNCETEWGSVGTAPRMLLPLNSKAVPLHDYKAHRDVEFSSTFSVPGEKAKFFCVRCKSVCRSVGLTPHTPFPGGGTSNSVS